MPNLKRVGYCGYCDHYVPDDELMRCDACGIECCSDDRRVIEDDDYSIVCMACEWKHKRGLPIGTNVEIPRTA